MNFALDIFFKLGKFDSISYFSHLQFYATFSELHLKVNPCNEFFSLENKYQIRPITNKERNIPYRERLAHVTARDVQLKKKDRDDHVEHTRRRPITKSNHI